MSIQRPLLTALIGCFLAGGLSAASESVNIPISFELERPATVTVVIEDAAGKRVRNLAAAVRLPPGKNLLSWDGYDDGERQKDGSTIRHLVAPGQYRARGVTSDGLKLIYEFPINSPGNPPWFTKERNGAWLADHTGGQAVVMVPAADQGFLGRGQSRLIVSAITAECGDAFMAIDLDGKKIIGNNDFGWTGAYAMTLDAGPQKKAGDQDPWLYCLNPQDNTTTLNAFTRGGKAFTIIKQTTKNKVTWNGGQTGDSVAAWNGIVVISVPHDGELLVVDPAAKDRLVGKIGIPDIRGVLFDDQGRLLISTATQIKRLTLDLKLAQVSREEVLVSSQLEDAQQITRDKTGNLYVGDWGKQHVIKVFSPAGKLVRTIGKPGGTQLGAFDRERLHFPKGMAIDERGQLWVVDADHVPKRISTWSTADGTLTRTIIGGPKYGGGGTLDPADRTRVYYGIFNGGYTLKLDWTAGTSVVESIYARPETNATVNPDNVPGMTAEDCLHVGGNTYLTNNFQASLGNNANQGSIWLIGKDKVARPVALIGGLQLMEESHGGWNPLKNPGIKELFATLTMETMIIWSDLNLDSKAQPNEITSWKVADPYVEAVRFQSDLSFVARNIAMPAPTILPNGVPVWSPEQKPVVVTGKQRANTILVDNGAYVTIDEPGLVGRRDGQITWEFPSESGTTLPSNTGTMIQIRRFLGAPFAAKQGEAGMMMGINGEKGGMYLLTTDGLFLQDVGGDNRIAPHMGTKYSSATRGMVVEGVSFHDEHYGPSLSQTKEGDVVLIAGKEYSAVFRVDGLASVKRRVFTTLDIDAKLLAGLPPTITVVPRKQNRLSLSVVVGGAAPKVDGLLSPGEWTGGETAWAILDGRARATLRIVGDRLYAAWSTGDTNALANATGEPKLLFKRGGAVDLMIACDPKADGGRRGPAAGDIRLITSMQGGKPTAVLFRAVVPGTAEAARVPFESPVGRVVFDRVEVVSDQIQLAQHEGDIELSIPLAVLGLTSVAEGTVLLGDIGILRGTGAMTSQRLYWNNLDTSICSDVPSEARLVPANWGKWHLVSLASTQRRPAAAKPTGLVPGLSWRSHEVTWKAGMDLAKESVTATGVAPGPDLKITKTRAENHAIVYEGFLAVPTDGIWTFSGQGDDGLRMWLGDRLVFDGLAGGEAVSGPLDLAAGLHPIRLDYIQHGGGTSLKLEWSGPGLAQKPIPAESFSRSP